jgi:hypothetical protein
MSGTTMVVEELLNEGQAIKASCGRRGTGAEIWDLVVRNMLQPCHIRQPYTFQARTIQLFEQQTILSMLTSF